MRATHGVALCWYPVLTYVHVGGVVTVLLLCCRTMVRISLANGEGTARFPLPYSSHGVHAAAFRVDVLTCMFVSACVLLMTTVDGGARPAPGGFGEKKRKKVYIPVDQYPDINFMGAC